MTKSCYRIIIRWIRFASKKGGFSLGHVLLDHLTKALRNDGRGVDEALHAISKTGLGAAVQACRWLVRDTLIPAHFRDLVDLKWPQLKRGEQHEEK